MSSLSVGTAIAIGLILVAIMAIFLNSSYKESEDEDDPVYLGPVRPGDDEEHFRKTGETRPHG